MKTERKAKAPKWLLTQEGMTTQRQWRQRKRADMRALMYALDDLRLGCVYMPKYLSIKRVSDQLDIVAHAVSVREWGR